MSQYTPDELDSKLLYDKQREFIDFAFGKAMAYMQVVAGIGYVGFFTAWSFMHDILPVPAKVFSAFFMSVSVFVYVIYEVIKMFTISTIMIQKLKELQNVEPEKYLETILDKKELRVTYAGTSFWFFCWGVCIVTGVLGSMILIGSFWSYLVESYFCA